MVTIIIGPDGSFRSVYDDDGLGILQAIGPVRVQRASRVEPEAGGTWSVDLRAVGGPFRAGYRRRDGALAAEKRWLLQNDIPEVRQ